MKVNDAVIHKRRVVANVDEKELFELIADAVAKQAGFERDTASTTRVFISKKDRVGTAGFEYYAEVELIRPISSEA